MMHGGVVNVPHELRSAEVGLADDCLPAEGRSSARKEMRGHPNKWP